MWWDLCVEDEKRKMSGVIMACAAGATRREVKLSKWAKPLRSFQVNRGANKKGPTFWELSLEPVACA